MPKLSEKRRTAIYKAVTDPLMDLRVKLSRENLVTSQVDYLIAQAMDEAGAAALRAAEGTPKEPTNG